MKKKNQYMFVYLCQIMFFFSSKGTEYSLFWIELITNPFLGIKCKFVKLSWLFCNWRIRSESAFAEQSLTQYKFLHIYVGSDVGLVINNVWWVQQTVNNDVPAICTAKIDQNVKKQILISLIWPLHCRCIQTLSFWFMKLT